MRIEEKHEFIFFFFFYSFISSFFISRLISQVRFAFFSLDLFLSSVFVSRDRYRSAYIDQKQTHLANKYLLEGHKSSNKQNKLEARIVSIYSLLYVWNGRKRNRKKINISILESLSFSSI